MDPLLTQRLLSDTLGCREPSPRLIALLRRVLKGDAGGLRRRLGFDLWPTAPNPAPQPKPCKPLNTQNGCQTKTAMGLEKQLSGHKAGVLMYLACHSVD